MNDSARAKKSSAPTIPSIRYADIKLEVDSDYLVKGLIDRGSLAEIFGEPGCGKTFLCTDLALSVAAGVARWMGHRVRGGPVVYIAAERPKSAERRIATWKLQHPQVDPQIPFRLIPGAVNLLQGQIGALLTMLRDFSEEHGAIALIVVDTLSRSMAGGNENAPEDMSAAVDTLARLSHKTGAAVLVVHHSGKDKTRGARGHSSLLGAVDSELEVVADDSGVRVLRSNKLRDYGKADEIAFRLDVLDLGTDRDGDQVTTCMVKSTDERPARVKRSLSEHQRQAMTVIEAAGERGIATVDLRAQLIAVGIKRTRVYDIVSRLTELGFVTDINGLLQAT